MGRCISVTIFGSLAKRIELQDQCDVNILIADVQALTDNAADPEKIRRNVYEVALDYLALTLSDLKDRKQWVILTF